MFKLPGGIGLIVNFFMAALILLAGLSLLFTNVMTAGSSGQIVLEGANRTILAVICLLYSAFRFTRAWQLYKQKQRDDDRKRWKKF